MTCQLVLLTPLVEDAEIFAPLLEQACAAAPIAAVILRFGEDDEQSLPKARTLVPLVQQRGIAALVEASPALALHCEADGVHIGHGIAALKESLRSLKPSRMVGAGHLATRHEAMEAAEAGADYVLFGEPHRDGSWPCLDAVVERASWWSKVFEVPCIACAPHLEAVPLLAQTGAEFVALGEGLWTPSISETLAQAARGLA